MSSEMQRNDLQWNSQPGFFVNQRKQEEDITLGPDLSWPYVSKPGTEQLKHQRNIVREMSRKAA